MKDQYQRYYVQRGNSKNEQQKKKEAPSDSGCVLAQTYTKKQAADKARADEQSGQPKKKSPVVCGMMLFRAAADLAATDTFPKPQQLHNQIAECEEERN